MATIVSTPGGRRASTIAPAPSYAGVVSKYASEISAALADETTNTVNQLVLDWKSGTISWEDFLTKYQAIMDDQPAGSSLKTQMGTNLLNYQTVHRDDLVAQKRSELTAQYSAGGTLSQTDSYNIERQLLSYYENGTDDYNKQMETVTNLYAKAIQEKVDNMRSTLLDKFSGGGVTPQEQLTIVNQLLTIAPVGTDTYNNLMTERANIQNSIVSTGKAENTLAASAAFEVADRKEKEQIIPDYQSGRMDGLTADTQNLENWKGVLELYKGLKGQAEGKTAAFIQERVDELQKQVDLRTQGRIFDAYIKDKSGNVMVSPIKLEDVVAGRDVGAVQPKVDYDAQADVFKVYDPRTGKYVAQSTNEADALRQAKALGIPGVITVKTVNGDQNYYYDTNKDSTTYNQFIQLDANTGKPVAAYPAIPVTPTQEKFKVPINANQISQPVNPSYGSELLKAVTKPGEFFSDVGAGIKSTAKSLGIQQPTGNLLERAGSAAKTAFNMTPTGALFNAFKGLVAGPTSIARTSSPVPTTTPTSRTTNSSQTPGIGQTLTANWNKVTNFVKGLFQPKS